jgi:hypothetical protein
MPPAAGDDDPLASEAAIEACSKAGVVAAVMLGTQRKDGPQVRPETI